MTLEQNGWTLLKEFDDWKIFQDFQGYTQEEWMIKNDWLICDQFCTCRNNGDQIGMPWAELCDKALCEQ